MDDLDRRAFVGKLLELREKMPSLYPPKEEHGFEEDALIENITQLSERLDLIFERFVVPRGKARLDQLRKEFKEKSLGTVEEPPWRAGQYAVLITMEDLIDDLLFVYSDGDGPSDQRPRAYRQLIQSSEVLRDP
jgi:hypothetical protein